jgi:hypothetical protein
MRIHVRSLCSEDFAALRQLEADIFGVIDGDVLCPHAVRRCSELFADTCFLALVDGKPVSYLLWFVRDREAYCTTLAVCAEFQRTRVTTLLIAAFVRGVVGNDAIDICWFTVEPDTAAARALHRVLGATETGDERIVSKIDRQSLDRLRSTYERLGLLPRAEAVAA